MITARVYGAPIDLADELEESFHETATASVSEAADVLLAEVQRMLRLRGGSPRTTAPEGQPPEYDEGLLFRSWKKIRPTIRGRVARSGVYSNSPYAVRQEFGGTDIRGVRVLEHPYLRPALERVDPLVEQIFSEVLPG